MSQGLHLREGRRRCRCGNGCSGAPAGVAGVAVALLRCNRSVELSVGEKAFPFHAKLGVAVYSFSFSAARLPFAAVNVRMTVR